ncbi:hypothetical protein JEZ13_08390 [bacterium]|nr:hypothetical protein [bacterium]
MKKNIVLLTFLLCSLSLFAESYIDSLQAVIESLPFSYEKADKIWDLALYQSNESNQPQEAIENYSKASEMFVEIDSLSQAFKTNGSIINVAFNNPEYYDYSKEAFTKQLSFFENKKLQKYKGDMLVFFLRHVTNAYLLKEMDYLKECLLLVEPYFKDNKYDYIKIDFDYISILTTSFFNGEQAALNQSMEVYDRLESGKYNLVFGKKQSMRVKLLSLMQNYHYYRGNIEQSNHLLDQAMFIAKDTYQNHPDSLSSMDKINFKVDITKIMTLKVDNIPIIEENLVDIEKDYLEVNDFSKSFDEERELNNFVKIAHAYDIVYSGNHEKISYYLNLVEKDLELLKNPVYLTNYQLTKARYMLNKKEYDQANSLFLKVEDFIDKTNQYWLKLNYIMERSRYYFEMGDPKTGYQMITTFYKTIDKDFSTDIAEKTAQLNNLLNTQRLQSDNLTLEKELEINSLKNSRSNLIIIIITISLAFAVIFLINNIIMRNKLQKALKKQSEELQQEIISN